MYLQILLLTLAVLTPEARAEDVPLSGGGPSAVSDEGVKNAVDNMNSTLTQKIADLSKNLADIQAQVKQSSEDLASKLIEYDTAKTTLITTKNLEAPPGLAPLMATSSTVKNAPDVTQTVTNALAAETQRMLQSSISAGDPKIDLYNKHQDTFQAVFKATDKPLNTSGMVDLNAATLIEKSTLSAAEVAQATQLIQNVTNPFPTGIDYNALKGSGISADSSSLPTDFDAEDKKVIAERMAEQAVLSVPEAALYRMLAERMATADGKDSLHSVLEKESTWRFLDNGVDDKGNAVEWYSGIATAATDTLLRELVQMEAFRLYMDYMRYKQSERLELLMATMVAGQGRLSTVMQNIAEQMDQSSADKQSNDAQMQTPTPINPQ